MINPMYFAEVRGLTSLSNWQRRPDVRRHPSPRRPPVRTSVRQARRRLPSILAATVLVAAVAAAPAAAAAGTGEVVTLSAGDSKAQVLAKASMVTPSMDQLAWQQQELTAFLHFGPNTFDDREWGTGAENPSVFNPPHLDTDQWARTLKAAGFKQAMLTVKHHDGLVLFPTRYTIQSVKSSS